MTHPTIWHNPRCSKSRQTLALLEGKGLEPVIVEYQKTAPSKAEIREVLSLLGAKPIDLIRSGEAIFKELGLSKTSTDEALITAMASHPILIERPVVLFGQKAALGRPPESVLLLFE